MAGYSPKRWARNLRSFASDLPRDFDRVDRQAAKDTATRARTRARRHSRQAAWVATTIEARGDTVTLGAGSDRRKAAAAIGVERGSKRYRQFDRYRSKGFTPGELRGRGYFYHPAVADVIGDSGTDHVEQYLTRRFRRL